MIAEMVIDTKTGEIGYLQKDFYGKIISPPHHKSVKTAFKEEFVWDKGQCTSPLMAVSRIHETISVFTKQSGTINKVKVPYLEMKGHDIDSVIGDVKRMRSILKNPKSLQAVESFLENNFHIHKNDKPHKYNVSAQISGLQTPDRSSAVIQSIQVGLNEKSIIKQVRDHYTAIHPTQKPVRLFERLLNLTIPKEKEEVIVADFFAGSGSTMEAVLNLQKQNPDKKFTGIATEIDEEYFEGMKNRIENLKENKIC